MKEITLGGRVFPVTDEEIATIHEIENLFQAKADGGYLHTIKALDFIRKFARDTEARVRAEYGATPEQVRALVEACKSEISAICDREDPDCDYCRLRNICQPLAPWGG